jgi:hypothetical protein
MSIAKEDRLLPSTHPIRGCLAPGKDKPKVQAMCGSQQNLESVLAHNFLPFGNRTLRANRFPPHNMADFKKNLIFQVSQGIHLILARELL